jgi:hypothetical protein
MQGFPKYEAWLKIFNPPEADKYSIINLNVCVRLRLSAEAAERRRIGF